MKHKYTITIPTDPLVLGYLAGIIDGEGSIRVRSLCSSKITGSRSYTPEVTVTNTDIRLIDWLLKHIGGRYFEKRRHKAREYWKQAYDWKIYGPNACALVAAVRPFLLCKTEQADLVLALSAVRETRVYVHGTGNTADYNEKMREFRDRAVALNERSTNPNNKKVV